MDKKSFHVLEYDKIIDLLTSFATTDPGKMLCKELLPSCDICVITQWQKQTSDAVSRIYRKGSISFSGVKDIRPYLKRLELGAGLSIIELLQIASLLRVVAKARSYGVRDVEKENADTLDELFTGLVPMTTIYNEINRCILSEEEIADDASTALSHIRRSLKTTKERIQSQLASLLQSQRSQLQDAVITMRNGRYCLPVKSEFKGQVSGLVHDQSATGSTIFIEPSAIVNLNNSLRELEIEEQREIEKVLFTLSNELAPHIDSLRQNYDLLSELDFIFAKAAFSRSYQGSEPDLNTNGEIQLKKARHPLIAKDQVVPIDVSLGKDYHQLIITGPNTGGKTVTLKTVGLCTLMGQAGLHIPAFDHSMINVFKEVYADIGDEQSIEQSLSTFSSHIKNIVPILEKADDTTLVLFDELGAGTDPTEGAALAIAILSFLHKLQVRTMATTHYSELKVYALSTSGVENACCEFNVETLRPTYRLLVGIPGKSNAFAISSKLGIPDFIIDDAKSHIDSDAKSFEDLISELEQARITMEAEKEEISRLKEEIAKSEKSIKERERSIDERKEKIIREANEKAQTMLSETKSFVDETIRNVNKKMSQSGLLKELEKDRSDVRNRLDDANSKLTLKQKQNTSNKSQKTLSAKDLHVGDRIRVLSLNLLGTVSTLPNAKGDFYAQMGILRSLVNLKDIELIFDEPTITAGNAHIGGTSKIKMNKSASVSTEVNLIGKTVDEALPVMEKYLDDAYLAHLEKVRVVHGRGTGALRNGIHQRLRKLKYVKSFHLGEYGEGDTGVTIVEFKY